MSPQLMSIYAAISASTARVAGMQAENLHRVACGNAVAYVGGHFTEEATQLDLLAIEARNAS